MFLPEFEPSVYVVKATKHWRIERPSGKLIIIFQSKEMCTKYLKGKGYEYRGTIFGAQDWWIR